MRENSGVLFWREAKFPGAAIASTTRERLSPSQPSGSS